MSSQLIELTLKQALNYHLLNHCTNCGTYRTRVPFTELPKDIKKEVKEFYNENYILYCKNCQEYSLVIEEK